MFQRLTSLFICAVGVSLTALSGSAQAHPGHGLGGFHEGWQHPLLGLDHLLAILCAGLLAVRCGGRGLWLIPLTFIGSMLLGGLVALTGVALPGVEFVLIGSVLVLGLLVASPSATPLRIAIGLITLFSFFQGYAHTSEMFSGAVFAQFVSGLLLTTAGLLSAAVLSGLALQNFKQVQMVRLSGAAMALAALVMFVNIV